jgi:hypothetical protein
VAAIAALVHVHDEVTWGILPTGCVPELWAAFGAQVAAAVSGNYARISGYRDILSMTECLAEQNGFQQLIAGAIALGFTEKWSDADS